jgi:hypothetical protein
VVVLVDISTSHVYPDTETEHQLIQAVQHVAASRAFGVTLRFGAFAGGVKIAPPVGGIRSVRDSLLLMFSVSPRYPSPLWDSINAAIDLLSSDSGTRAVVVVSDGKASGNHRTREDVTEAALRGGYIIGAVSGVSEKQTDPRLMPWAHLQAMSVTTGGEFVGIGFDETVPVSNEEIIRRTLRGVRHEPPALGPLIAGLLARLSLRHRVTFEAPGDGQTHALTVRTRETGFRTLAPDRFFSPRR